MTGFALLWSKILTSSIWLTDKETRLVWITMLALKDSQGRVMGTAPGLAHIARVSPEGCRKALALFMAPDPDSSTKTDDGRRIREIPGGWQLINHEQYRFSTEARREYWAEQKRKQRQAKSRKVPKLNQSGIPLAGETSACRHGVEIHEHQ